MANLLKSKYLDLTKLTDAFPYQREAIDVVRDLDYSAIFFEQGLGKTKIAIDLTLDWLEEDIVDTVIIVTKKGLVRNWQKEFSIHSNLHPSILSSNRKSNHDALFSSANVFLANFEALALDKKKIESISKHRQIGIILDESQKIKNPDSQLTQTYMELREVFKKRVIMTGTPMANRPYDIWSQIFFLDGGDSLGINFAAFKSSLDIPKEGARTEFLKALGDVMPDISSFAIRQTKQGSGLELPGKIYNTVYANWEPEQERIYNRIRDELQIEFEQENRLIIDSVEELLKRLIRLSQAASNPMILDDRYAHIPGKFEALKQLIDSIVSQGEKAIVWTSHLKNCSYLLKHLAAYHAVQVNGSMEIDARDRSVSKFLEDKNVSVLVATPQAAKEGLTLTVANHVIFYDRTFSLDDYLQAQDRIHRISQTKTCYVTNLVLPNSIDEWIDALIELKASAVSLGMGDVGMEEAGSSMDVDLEKIMERVLGEK